MLNGIRIYSSDIVWRQILADLNATVVDTADTADVNMDTLNITQPIDSVELKALILGAQDSSGIISKIFGRDVTVPRLQGQIIAMLHKHGAMSAMDIKVGLGYSPNATTHVVSTAIYQLRQRFGHNFIKNINGMYSLGNI